MLLNVGGEYVLRRGHSHCLIGCLLLSGLVFRPLDHAHTHAKKGKEGGERKGD